MPVTRIGAYAVAVALLAGGCSVQTDGAPCASRDNCPANQGCAADGRCRALDCGGCAASQACNEGSLACQPRYALALTAPVSGSYVGVAGVAATATLTLGSLDPAKVPVPAEVQLLVDGAPAPSPSTPTLSKVAQDGATVTYAGTYRPPAGVEAASVKLTAQLADGSGAQARLWTSGDVTIGIDTVPPAVGTPTLTCSTNPCLRDAVLTISLSSQDAALQSVTAALDLDGGTRTVPLAATGSGVYSGQLPLRDWAFPFYQRTVAATVTVVDHAGNAVRAPIGSVDVTRLRWKYDARAPVTSPAVLADGTLVVGAATTVGQLRWVSRDGRERASVTLEPSLGGGGKAVTYAPAVGPLAVWAGAEDGRVYGAKLDGTGLAMSPCSGGSDATVYTPAVSAGTEVAIAASAGSTTKQILSAGTDGSCNRQATDWAATTSVVLVGTNPTRAMLATVNNTQSAWLAQFIDSSQSPGLLTKGWIAPAGLTMTAPLAVRGNGLVIAASTNGAVYAIDAAAATGVADTLATLAAAAEGSVVIGAGGDLVFGTNDGALHRLTAAPSTPWPDAWAGATLLGSAVNGVALVARDASGVILYATRYTSSSGEVVAVAEVSGNPKLVWSTSGLATGKLQFPTVAPPQVGAPATDLPTLFVGAGDGHLYAIVVDTPLDPASPWPKAHHDLRNTGNNVTPLP